MYRTTCRKLTTVLMLLAGSTLLLTLSYTARAQPPPLEITLTLGDYRFTPDSFDVHAGTPVILTLVNKDGITPHNFTLQDVGAGLNIDRDVAAGATETLEFIPISVGSYRFYCDKKLPFMKSHRERGMQGTLHVIESPMD